MSQATFYLMEPDENLDAIEALQGFACQLAHFYYEKQLRIYVHCGNRTDAHQIDELLWRFEASAFVPHNLKGSGPQGGSPVEIGYDPQGPQQIRHLLINLADQAPAFAVNFSQIIDFVAADDVKKTLARERYRQYRGMSIELQTQDLAKDAFKFV
ncbi:DNA polymerase III subunit chi [Parashewanella spongiae]|uniref:DNA polymerase III subunit chi n=1 Tax=Parashewanella spongiae TaxID=342950 RepID=UPI001059DDE3|nr:DNA polymerase III subunit chi [Parashewanella spongiae]MCL1079759.1 DNA polymerase III subunit chi [Parashewanella spongiae]